MSFVNLKNHYSSGKIHFIGIGGIGMSAIALILHKIGCQIQGSDLSQNNNTKTLEALGIKCFVGHKEENITDDVILVIETSIVKTTNPEFVKAKARNIPIIRRADMLAKIMGESDLAIGAAGSTSWERCCMGLPTIILVLAKNQALVASRLQEAGAVYIININDDLSKQFNSFFKKFLNNEYEIIKMIQAAKDIVDGRGLMTVVSHMEM
jgi:spore coat polysaccharide biosynthesis predicted glycosyltransferase SpsG